MQSVRYNSSFRNTSFSVFDISKMAESSDFSDDIRRETDEKSDNCSVTDENKAVAKTKTPHSVESDETLTGVQFHSAM